MLGTFPIIERVGSVAYRLGLPEHLQRIHDVFHVVSLKKYRRSERYFLHILHEDIDLLAKSII